MRNLQKSPNVTFFSPPILNENLINLMPSNVKHKIILAFIVVCLVTPVCYLAGEQTWTEICSFFDAAEAPIMLCANVVVSLCLFLYSSSITFKN